MNLVLPFGLLLLFLSACQPPSNTTNGADASAELIFGEFYGRCRGDEQCVEIFKVTQEGLYEDQRDLYPNGETLQVSFKALSSAQYQKAKALLQQFPSQLLQSDQPAIGCPDCVDQGGYLIAYQSAVTKGKRKIWRLDKKLDQLPEYLRPFAQSIEATIDAIQAGE